MDQLNVINERLQGQRPGASNCQCSDAAGRKEKGYSGSSQYIRRETTPLPAQETWWRFNRGAARVGGGNLCGTMDRAETCRPSWNVFYSRSASSHSGARPAGDRGHDMQTEEGGPLGQEPCAMPSVPSAPLAWRPVEEYFKIASQYTVCFGGAQVIAVHSVVEELMRMIDVKPFTRRIGVCK